MCPHYKILRGVATDAGKTGTARKLLVCVFYLSGRDPCRFLLFQCLFRVELNSREIILENEYLCFSIN